MGTKSPQLWKMLLNRRNWPFNADDDLDAYRDTFISHYVACRDIRAIARASSLLCVENSLWTTADKTGTEYAMQRYKSTKGAPVFNDEEHYPAKVKIWSESVYEEKVGARALAAYSHDNSLRLFEVVPRNNTPGTKCRQIACVKPIPPSVSQRGAGTYCLDCMALDEDVVACLFSCEPQMPTTPHTFVLSIISRDDLACAGNEGLIDDDSLREFEIRAMILDFLLCGANQVDHLQTALHEYLSVGDGDTSNIRVEVSPSLVSCGRGYFLSLAFVDIPAESDIDSGSDDDRSHANPSRCGHRAFLLSTKKGRIVKSVHIPYPHAFAANFYFHASNPVQKLFSIDDASSVRKLCTNVVVKCADSTEDWSNFSIQISKNGTIDVQMKAVLDGRQIQPIDTIFPMPVIVTPNCIVSSAEYACLVFLYDKGGDSLYTDIHRIEVGESSTEICDMFNIREEYVVVILGTRQGPNNDEDAVAGEWFGLDEDFSAKREAVVYHISSRQELFRCSFPYTTPTLFHMDCIGDTVAANVAKFGFVIAGGNAREVARTVLNDEGDANQTPTKTQKAKKKRLASLASGRKKDGFARGMSMRG